jgi:phosphohistidine phosphatase
MIVLVHHGEAVGPEVDPMRPLSDAGRAAAARLAEEAARRGVRPELIWHSGKLRARQTAKLFWHACNPLAVLSAARGLQPDDPPTWMRDQLAGDTRAIMLVGHMPHLGRLLHLLRGTSPNNTPEFSLHGCVALEPDGENWKELWRLP